MLTMVCHQAGGEVTVKGVREIIAVMRCGASEQKLRATVALTNVLPDSDSNRMNAHAAGQSCFVLCALFSYFGPVSCFLSGHERQSVCALRISC